MGVHPSHLPDRAGRHDMGQHGGGDAMTEPNTPVDQPTEPPPATKGGISPILILGILGIVGVIALVVIIVVLLVASSPGPTLTVAPTSAPPGTVVHVSGTG